MSPAIYKNGVIEKATGDLLRAGHCSFTHDPATEEYRTDVPEDCYCRYQLAAKKLTRWTGTEWIIVPA
jgi:hypothetical protein